MVSSRPASLPANVRKRVTDVARLEVLAALWVMDSHTDDDFARINRVAAAIFNAPSAAIAVVDASRAWLVSAVGSDLREIPVEHSFAAHCIGVGEPMVVLDASRDKRFENSALVTGPPGIRFYVGSPIVVRGQRIGALQVFATEPRDGVPGGSLAQLADLAATCGRLFELKDEARVRARTSAELIKEEWRHALTLEAGKVGSWVWDIRSRNVVGNEILHRMFGLPAGATITIDDIFAAIHPDDRGAVNEALTATFDEGVDYQCEYRIASSGRWLVGRGRVYQRDAAGRPLIMMGVNIDVTQAHEAAEHTRHLLRELNHRVKNTLAMIQSLARQTMSTKPDPQEFLEAFAGRLRTLSDAHAVLAERDWVGIGLIELIRIQVTPYLMSRDQLVLDGDDLQLPPDHALGLGVVLHELASNAARYGAMSRDNGRVAIGWKSAANRLEMTWVETGGPQVGPAIQRRFGSRLIERGLDKVLESRVELEFEPSGVRAHIDLPLS